MSENKKIVHELGVDELVKLAAEAKEPVVQDDLSEVGRFIFDKQIKHGDTKIPAELIYHTYKEWKNLMYRRFMTKGLFFKHFKKVFTPERNAQGIFYFLDPSSFDLSRENYFFMRAVYRREKLTKKSQKTQKSGKKPGSDQKV